MVKKEDQPRCQSCQGKDSIAPCKCKGPHCDWGLTKTERRAESLRASQRIESLLSASLDPKLWSELPREFLWDIHNALPVKDYYRLRRVCKAWNDAASERRCPGGAAADPRRVRAPFFLLIRQSEDENSTVGTLALHVASGRWIWRLCSPEQDWETEWEIGHLMEPFVVDGVLFEGSVVDDGWNVYDLSVHKNLLLDVHKKYHDRLDERRIPHVAGSVLGMMVDGAREYKLVVGDCAADTLVLDSRTNRWESKPSRMVREKPPSKSSAPKSCVQLAGKMYLWVDSDEIHVYSPAEEKWSALGAPPRDASEDEFRGLGHWDGALYAVTKNQHGTLSVWKNTQAEEWGEYAQIPGSLFSHLMRPGAVLPIVASHCNGYFLMHVLEVRDGSPTTRLSDFVKLTRWWSEDVPLGRRFVLFNISNKRWEIVDLPYSKLWKGSSR